MNYKIIAMGLVFSSMATYAQTSTRLYAGVQAGLPLFWGDIRSVGTKTNLGYGAGAFLGVQANRWLAAEFSIDYGEGKLNASKWQTEDYINDKAVITYISGTHKLGTIYSRTQFLRAGLRLPVSLVQAFSTYKEHRFTAELAPHLYFNKFTPGIYSVSDNKKIMDGVKPANWAYAIGGDVALGYWISPKTSLFLRPSLSWLSDERFEGISSDPLWRANLMAYTTLGIRFHFGKALPAKSKAITTPAYTPPVNPTIEKKEEIVTIQKKEPTENSSIVIEDAEVKRRRILLDEMQRENVPVIYFKRGNATLQNQYNETMQRLLLLAKKYDFAPIKIEGWCDVTGTERINSVLSQNRATAVANWLIQNGISSARITATGMGVDEANGETQQARRSQLKFIAKED